MSNIITDIFWEDAWGEYGAEYQAQTTRSSLSDFQVWLEDKGLVPEMEDYER